MCVRLLKLLKYLCNLIVLVRSCLARDNFGYSTCYSSLEFNSLRFEVDILESEWLSVLAPRLPVMVGQPVRNLYTVFSHSGPAHSKRGHLCFFVCVKDFSTQLVASLHCSRICVTAATRSRDTGCKWAIIRKVGYLAVTIAVLYRTKYMYIAASEASNADGRS